MKTLGSFLVIILAGLLVPGVASAQSECENACEECDYDPELWHNLGFGVSLWMTWFEPTGGCSGPYSCAPWRECRGPEEEEDAKPQEALEAEIDQLFDLERNQVLSWVKANRGDFQMAVVEGTLQVATPCGAVITWVALDPSQLAVTRALLEEDF
jgi:hypothetical protein